MHVRKNGGSSLIRWARALQAALTDGICCGDDCTVPWSAFKLSFRGQPVEGPPLTEHLHSLSHIGLGTSGTAGKFEIDLLSLIASANTSSTCKPQ